MSQENSQKETPSHVVTMSNRMTSMDANDSRVKLAYLKGEYKKLKSESVRLRRTCFMQQQQTVQQEHYIHQLESLNHRQQKIIQQLSQQVQLERELAEDALLMLHNGQNLLIVSQPQSHVTEGEQTEKEMGWREESDPSLWEVDRMEEMVDESFAESQFLEQHRRRYTTDQVIMALYNKD